LISINGKALFPLLAARAGHDTALMSALSRLKGEHQMDEGYCDEVLELLSALSNSSPENAEAAGYLLRGLFECMRRHIAFEEDYLLPKARAVFKDDDLRALASNMASLQIGRKAACFNPTVRRE
jgi:hemerythrin-like domain-containing protein